MHVYAGMRRLAGLLRMSPLYGSPEFEIHKAHRASRRMVLRAFNGPQASHFANFFMIGSESCD